MTSGFHDVRFPTDISYGSAGGPEFSTEVIEVASGHEQRNVNWNQARARYDVAYGVRGMAQLAALIAFFRARRGRAFGFRYKDWADYASAGPGETPASLDQPLGEGDGAQTAFQLIKRYGADDVSHDRDITKPVAGSVRIAFDGVEQASGFTVDASTGIVTFQTPPASGVAITAGFEFDVPVRFDTDRLSTALDDYGVGSAVSVPLVEIRA